MCVSNARQRYVDRQTRFTFVCMTYGEAVPVGTVDETCRDRGLR